MYPSEVSIPSQTSLQHLPSQDTQSTRVELCVSDVISRGPEQASDEGRITRAMAAQVWPSDMVTDCRTGRSPSSDLELRSGRALDRSSAKPSMERPMRGAPRREGPIQIKRSEGIQAKGVREEVDDREGAEPRMSIQGCLSRHRYNQTNEQTNKKQER